MSSFPFCLVLIVIVPLTFAEPQATTPATVPKDRKLEIPQTLDDVDAICRSNRNNLNCVKRYEKCLQAFPRQMFSMIFRSINGLYKEVCSADGKKELLKHMQCFKNVPEEKMAEIVDMFHKLTAMLNHVNKGSNNRALIPGACCAYVKSVEQAKATLQSVCGSCPGTPNYLLRMFREAAHDVMDLSCSRYQNIASCQKLLSQTLRRFDDLTKNVSPQSTGFFVPLMNIGKRLTISDVL